MGVRFSSSTSMPRMAPNRQGSSSLLKLLDELYVGGLPSAAPQPGIDQTKMPSKSLLAPKALEEDDEEDESVSPPVNVLGSY